MKLTKFVTALVLSTASLSFSAQAAEKMKPMAEMTTAQREEMAAAHEKMATCLRSDKPVMDCHKEMMESCKDKMGKMSCPMMGDMSHMHDMMGKGKKHDHSKMQKDEAEEHNH